MGTKTTSPALKTDDSAPDLCHPAPEFRAALINHSWATLPTFWQGAAPELSTVEQLEAATKFSMVVVTLHHGRIADAIAACRRVKLAAPSVSCLMYWTAEASGSYLVCDGSDRAVSSSAIYAQDNVARRHARV